MLRPAD